MSDKTLLYMWKSHRQTLISTHGFYVEQAKLRLVSQFENIEAEADQAAADWLKRNNDQFDPERDELGDFYEGASDASIEVYSLLSDMRDQTILNVVAWMFHEWDKQLRDWLAREIRRWHSGAAVAEKVWSADFAQIVELLESFGWPISRDKSFSYLDACRLVVNVYKHGKGKSLEELKQKYPEYLQDPFSGVGGPLFGIAQCDHTHLRVSKEQLQVFSDTIIGFWRAVPEHTFYSQCKDVPGWFEKALLKDRSSQQQRTIK
jgi:hypothetical protein